MNFPLGRNLELFSTLAIFFTDDYTLTVDGDPDLRQDSYSKIDLRLGIGAPDNRWSVAFVGRNLTDEDVLEWKGNTPAEPTQGSHFALLKRTRQVALQGTFRFGN